MSATSCTALTVCTMPTLYELTPLAPTPSHALIEAGGIYWHMVDFLWFLIFALLCLMR